MPVGCGAKYMDSFFTCHIWSNRRLVLRFLLLLAHARFLSFPNSGGYILSLPILLGQFLAEGHGEGSHTTVGLLIFAQRSWAVPLSTFYLVVSPNVQQGGQDGRIGFGDMRNRRGCNLMG
jgi:hypothetical protein